MKYSIKKGSIIFLVLAFTLMFSSVSAFADEIAEISETESELYYQEAYYDGTAPGNNIKIMLNGELMNFDADSQPERKNGRTMVPFRAMFESLGAQVEYDNAAKTISGSAGDLSVTMKNGDYNINIKNADGTSRNVTMDVAPYISNGRTFVPTRFVSEVLGYSVGWDADNKTVIIIDANEITKNADNDFSILMKSNDLSADMNKTYDVAGNVKADISSSTGAGDMDMSLTGDINGRVKGINEELSMNMKIDADGEKEDVKAEVKLNGETGDMYMKAEGLSESDQWLKLNLYDISEAAGMDMKALMDLSASGSVNMKKALDVYFDSLSDTYDVDTYDVLKVSYDVMKSMLGNDAFKKSGNSYVAEFSENTVAKALTDAAGSDASEVLKQLGLEDVKLSGKVAIDTDANDKAEKCSVEFNVEDHDTDMKLVCVSSALAADIAFDVNIADTMKMAFDMNMNMKESSGSVNTSIPAGETAVDLNNLLNGLIGGEGFSN